LSLFPKRLPISTILFSSVLWLEYFSHVTIKTILEIYVPKACDLIGQDTIEILWILVRLAKNCVMHRIYRMIRILFEE